MKKNKDDLLKAIGLLLRVSRKKQGLTQKAVAEKAGMNEKHLGRIERGESNIKIKSLELLCNELEISMPNLLRKALEYKMASFAARKRFAYLTRIDLSKRDKK